MNEQFKNILYLSFNLLYRMLPFLNCTYLTACWIKSYAVHTAAIEILACCVAASQTINELQLHLWRKKPYIRKCSKKHNSIQNWKGFVWIFAIGLDLRWDVINFKAVGLSVFLNLITIFFSHSLSIPVLATVQSELQAF